MMEEIPLDSPRPQEDETITDYHPTGAQKEHYKETIRNEFQRMNKFRTEHWSMQKEECNHIHLLKLTKEPSNKWSHYQIKAILNCAPERLHTLITDNSYVTRSQWDINALGAVEQRESYDTNEGPILVVQTKLQMPKGAKALGVKDRDYIGLQWSRFSSATETYTVVFTTISHELYQCSPGCVPGNTTILTFVKPMENNRCFLQCTIEIEPLPAVVVSFFIERINARLLMMEHVCNTKYEAIYNRWLCATCPLDRNAVNDPNLLECRYCKVARYWKCLHINCKRSQPVNALDRCAYCGEERME